MTRVFTCPECRSETTISEDLVGTTGGCAHCGGVVTIDDTNTQSAAAPKRLEFRVLAIGLAYIFGLALLGAIALFILFNLM